MILSVRKGLIFVEFDFHPYGARSIGTKEWEIEPTPDRTIIRLCLSPIDGNQRDDQRWFEDSDFSTMTVSDEKTVRELARLLVSSFVQSERLVLEIRKQEAILRFRVTIHARSESLVFRVAEE